MDDDTSTGNTNRADKSFRDVRCGETVASDRRTSESDVPECSACGGPAPDGRPRQYGDETFGVVCRRRCDDSEPFVEYNLEVDGEPVGDEWDDGEVWLSLTSVEGGFRVEGVNVR